MENEKPKTDLCHCKRQDCYCEPALNGKWIIWNHCIQCLKESKFWNKAEEYSKWKKGLDLR